MSRHHAVRWHHPAALLCAVLVTACGSGGDAPTDAATPPRDAAQSADTANASDASQTVDSGLGADAAPDAASPCPPGGCPPRRVTLFGGLLSDATDEMWSWDGTAWSQLRPPVRPSARYAPGMAFDEARHRLVLFGGLPSLRVSSDPQDDTWEWDGTAWTERSPAQRPVGVVGSLAYDRARRVTVLFGTRWPPAVGSSTWEWDGASWRERTPTLQPPPRSSGALAYDAARRVVVLFGGVGESTTGVRELDDTWEWDGVTWVERAVMRRPDARSGHAMAYDTARRRVVLFGGVTRFPGVDTRHGDTWEWDGAAWTMVSLLSAVSGRHGHAMVYDEARARTVLFGGQDTFSPRADTWEFNGADWGQVNVPGGPSPRVVHGLAY